MESRNHSLSFRPRRTSRRICPLLSTKSTRHRSKTYRGGTRGTSEREEAGLEE